MSLLTFDCDDLLGLRFEEIVRLVSDVDDEGHFYIRMKDCDDETEPLAQCDGSYHGLDEMFRGMLIFDTDDGLIKLRAKIS